MCVCAQCQVSFCSLYALRPPRELALSVAFFCRGCFDRGLVKPVSRRRRPRLLKAGVWSATQLGGGGSGAGARHGNSTGALSSVVTSGSSFSGS